MHTVLFASSTQRSGDSLLLTLALALMIISRIGLVEGFDMRPLQLYVETSVFGFLFDESDFNRAKKEATLRLFDQLADGRLLGHVSAPVLAELLQTPDDACREALLEAAKELVVLPDPDSYELDFLTRLYLTKRAFPPDKRDDAIHVAFLVLNPGLDAMVSWNCRHLANENNRRYLKALTLAEGYPFDFEIITPEEALVYD